MDTGNHGIQFWTNIARSGIEQRFFCRFLNMRAMHDKYGPVIRLSRTVLSVADKDMLKQVLVTDDLRKGVVYDNTQCKLS
jgi:hypothetical protein